MNGTSPRRAHAVIALVLLVLGGLGLRLLGVGFLLPEQSEPDGVVYAAQVRFLQEGRAVPELGNQYTFYPYLVARIAEHVAAPRAYPAPARSLDEHRERAASPRLRLRVLVACLSLLAVPATWLLARRFLEPAFALLASAFMAASFLALWFAEQARPHAVSSACAALALAAALWLRERGGWRAYAVAGLCAALAIGSLQSGVFVLPPLVVAAGLRWRTGADSFARAIGGTLLALAIVAVLSLWFYPFMLAGDSLGEIGQRQSMLHISGHLVDLTLFDGGGFATVLRSAWEYEPLVSALAALGIVLGLPALWRWRSAAAPARRDAVWILCSFAIPYALVIGLYARTYQRFVLPLVPLGCVLAAYALWRMVRFARERGSVAGHAAVMLALALVSLQALAAFRLAEARAQPSTVDVAAQWIEEHLPAGARIAYLPMIEPPLVPTPDAFAVARRVQTGPTFLWTEYLKGLEDAPAVDRRWNLFPMDLTDPAVRSQIPMGADPFVSALGADYVVLPVTGNQWRVVPRAIREACQRLGRVVARFTPDAVDRGLDVEYVHQDDHFSHTSPWFFRALFLARVGHVVEIYEIRK